MLNMADLTLNELDIGDSWVALPQEHGRSKMTCSVILRINNPPIPSTNVMEFNRCVIGFEHMPFHCSCDFPNKLQITFVDFMNRITTKTF